MGGILQGCREELLPKAQESRGRPVEIMAFLLIQIARTIILLNRRTYLSKQEHNKELILCFISCVSDNN